MDLNVKEANNRIRVSRERTNILHKPEFIVIEFLCRVMPNWVTPNMMTVTGVLGSMIIAYGMYLSQEQGNSIFLVLSVVGFAIQWFGDSLDGRLAHYRNIPRKWYGWSLDIFADWCSMLMTSIGIYFYFPDAPFLSLLFLFAYGGTLILTIAKFTITEKYTIDVGIFGPTELRVITCFMFLLELVIPGFLYYFGYAAPFGLFIANYVELNKVLKFGNERDDRERKAANTQNT